MNKFDWPLNDSHFTTLDRLRIAKFFLNPKNRWTQGDLVKEYEKKWANFVGSKYAVMTSSGSTANTLMAMRVKDSLGREFRTRNRVILPAVTWQTSVSPWIREGFRPVFIDIAEYSLCMNMDLLGNYLFSNHEKVACVFPTTLLGSMPYMEDLYFSAEKYNKVSFMMDNCESSFGTFRDGYMTEEGHLTEARNVSRDFTSSTSMYFGHQATTGGEGGMIFTNKEDEYEYFLMARNHGMVRSLELYGRKPFQYSNSDVDDRFDFNLLGNNYRSSDINAFIGLIDFEKIEDHRKKRKILSEYIYHNLNEKYIKIEKENILFAFPIIRKAEIDGLWSPLVKDLVKGYCARNNIEYRPIISGNLLRHTAYKNYKQGPFPVADKIHNDGLYVGLYPNLKIKKLEKLIKFLNEI